MKSKRYGGQQISTKRTEIKLFLKKLTTTTTTHTKKNNKKKPPFTIFVLKIDLYFITLIVFFNFALCERRNKFLFSKPLFKIFKNTEVKKFLLRLENKILGSFEYF